MPSWYAVILSSALTQVYGMLLFGPILGNLWLQGIRINKNKPKYEPTGDNQPLGIALHMVFSLIQGYVLMSLYEKFGFVSLFDCLGLSVTLFLAFNLGDKLSDLVWEERSWKSVYPGIVYTLGTSALPAICYSLLG
jgi:hypothetical protein